MFSLEWNKLLGKLSSRQEKKDYKQTDVPRVGGYFSVAV